MKIPWAILILGLSLGAEAQMSESPRSRPRPKRARPQAVAPPTSPSLAVNSGFYVAALYSSANEVRYKGQISTPTISGAFTATESTSGAFGLGGGYQYLQTNWFGFDFSAAFEFPRGSSGIRGTSGSNSIRGDYEGDVSTSLLSFVGNANYSIGVRAYVSAGLNFPMVFSSSTMKMQGLPGYQLGVGGRLTESLSIGLDYRVLRMKGTIDVPPMKLTIEEASFPGFILSVRYSI